MCTSFTLADTTAIRANASFLSCSKRQLRINSMLKYVCVETAFCKLGEYSCETNLSAEHSVAAVGAACEMLMKSLSFVCPLYCYLVGFTCGHFCVPLLYAVILSIVLSIRDLKTVLSAIETYCQRWNN